MPTAINEYQTDKLVTNRDEVRFVPLDPSQHTHTYNINI